MIVIRDPTESWNPTDDDVLFSFGEFDQNPEFEKYIPDIYPAELQLNKANTSDKETSFLDLNIKVIGSDIHTSVYDNRDDFGFPIVNLALLVKNLNS